MWCLWSLLCTSGILLWANCAHLCFSSFLVFLLFLPFSAQNLTPAQSTNPLNTHSTVKWPKIKNTGIITTPTDRKRPERVYALSVIWREKKADDWIPFRRFENEIIHFSSPSPYFSTPLLPLFPPALGVSVLDVDVFLSSHAEMSAFRGGRGRKVPILLPG